jgi:hypothetical protein
LSGEPWYPSYSWLFRAITIEPERSELQKLAEILRFLIARKARETTGMVRVVGESRELEFGWTRPALIDADVYEAITLVPWHPKKKTDQPGEIYVQHTSRDVGGRAGKRRTLVLHRLLLLAPPGLFVDHRNGNTLDNRSHNLRLCTAKQNGTNVVNSWNRKRGGYKGVSWNRRGQKWEAAICAGDLKPDGKHRRLYLGLFVDPVDAARAYDAAALKYFGEFAALNFPLLDDEEAQLRRLAKGVA